MILSNWMKQQQKKGKEKKAELSLTTCFKGKRQDVLSDTRG